MTSTAGLILLVVVLAIVLGGLVHVGFFGLLVIALLLFLFAALGRA